MGMFDRVKGILPPYQDQFKLWECLDHEYEHGDLVPSVGMATTYAVLLKSSEPASPRYLWVQENRITNLMAHQPVPDANVFDKWGDYKGRQGVDYKPPQPAPPKTPVSLAEQLQEADARRRANPPVKPFPELPPELEEALSTVSPVEEDEPVSWEDVAEVPNEATDDFLNETIQKAVLGPFEVEELPSPDEEAAAPIYKHKLRLRDDFVVELILPKDLTENEARRLGAWAEALVIGRGPRL